MDRKLRWGMSGGGPGGSIGAVHRIAARMDGGIELVCGAFSSQEEKSKAAGKELFLPPERIYASYQQMIESEKELPADQRMDFVSITTPNHLHFEPAMLALQNGFHVVLDKPMTFTLQKAKDLKKQVESPGSIFCFRLTYTCYPMVKQARQMVLYNVFGLTKKLFAEYPLGWLSTFLAG